MRLCKSEDKVILMADLGDLREGFMDDSTLITTAHLVQDEMPGLVLAGVGVNLTCFSFVQSNTEKLK